MMELIGWIGSLAFAICGAPQAYKSIKDGHSDGLSWGILILWNIGEVFSLIYAIHLGKLPLLANFIGNLIFVSIMTYYKVRPRRDL